jgi:DNA-binding MarR family transcriptional regulator
MTSSVGSVTVTEAHAQIERALIALSRRVTDPRGNRVINEMAGADIERAGATMLARIYELQPARLSDLACAAGVDISTASRQVARLVDLGFVARVPDPDDGRATRHSLSATGADLRDRLVQARHEWIDAIVVDLSPGEREVLGDLLGRVIDRMTVVDDEARQG